MLARTANGLFWMARYLERAETSGRLTGTAHRIALTKLKDQELHWLSAMKSAGVDQEFLSSGSVITKQNAIDWLLRSSLNPSSALTSLTHARNNARLVRTAITSEVWENYLNWRILYWKNKIDNGCIFFTGATSSLRGKSMFSRKN